MDTDVYNAAIDYFLKMFSKNQKQFRQNLTTQRGILKVINVTATHKQKQTERNKIFLKD